MGTNATRILKAGDRVTPRSRRHRFRGKVGTIVSRDRGRWLVSWPGLAVEGGTIERSADLLKAED